MWLNLIIILVTVLAGVTFGFIVFRIIIKIQDTLRAKASNSVELERPAIPAVTEPGANPSPEQPLDEAEDAPDFKNDAGTTTKDDDWLNAGVSEASTGEIKKADDDWLNAGLSEVSEASARPLKKEDNDWLNAGVDEVPTNVLKQRDNEWLNAGTDQSPEIIDDADRTTSRDFQITREGRLININVTATRIKRIKPEKTVISLKIHEVRQDSARKRGWPYGMGAITGDLSSSLQSLQDFVTIKPLEEAVSQNHLLMDEISRSPLEVQGSASHALMDEVTLRPVEKAAAETHQLDDQVSIRPLDGQVTEIRGLLDELSTKPSPGPVHIEYEILDDLITKRAVYRTKKPTPPGDGVTINPVQWPTEKTEPINEARVIKPVEKPVENTEPLKPNEIKEFTEFLKQKRNMKQSETASEATMVPAEATMASAGYTMASSEAAMASAAARIRKSSALVLDFPVTLPLAAILLSLGYLMALGIAELINYFVNPIAGIVIYLFIHLSLIINGILTKDRQQRNFFIALSLAPLIRLIYLAVPGTLVISQYLGYVLTAVPIIAGIIPVIRSSNFSLNAIGLNFNKPLIQLIVAITGIGLAVVDYWILKPAAWTTAFTIEQTLFPAIVLLICAGLIVELSFRGVMQRASAALGPYGWILIAAIYSVLQIGQGSVLHCVFSLGVGLFFGWTVKKTGSISGVSAAQGLINIGIYLVLPHIF